MLVKCLNCDIIWRRVAPDDNPGGTVPSIDICLVCPHCHSNAYRPLSGPELDRTEDDDASK